MNRGTLAVVAVGSGAAFLSLACLRRKSSCKVLNSGLPSNSCEFQTEPTGRTLLAVTVEVVRLLKCRQPVRVEGVDSSKHYLPPKVPKVCERGGVSWSELGDLVVQAERDIPGSGKVPGDRWISLRLDGTGFSKAVAKLRRLNLLEDGFSAVFADVMRECCCHLMREFSAKVGFTQSDEITLLLAPSSVVRGQQQEHLRGGRVVKLCTVAAGLATSVFNARLAKLGISMGLDPADFMLNHFDCRLGHYASWEEAQSVLLWRAYDCSVNGVSDAVHQTKRAGKGVMGSNTADKLKWLAKENLLPLPEHQAYGAYFVKVRRLILGFNPQKQESVTTLRNRLEQVQRCGILDLAIRDELLPVDDVSDALQQ